MSHREPAVDRVWREAGVESGRVSAVTRSVARLMTLAVVMLFAGCGGGSSTKSAQTVSGSGTSRAVSAKEGEFRTIIPAAYTKAESSVQYWARGPEEDGFVTSVLVARERARKDDINSFARRTVRLMRRAARRVSRLEALSVDGVPAFAVDYIVTGGGTAQGKVLHVRQVMVKHGAWIFLIRDFALLKQYPASLEAQDEVIRNWHWQ
jgi:hypothetical protein